MAAINHPKATKGSKELKLTDLPPNLLNKIAGHILHQVATYNGSHLHPSDVTKSFLTSIKTNVSLKPNKTMMVPGMWKSGKTLNGVPIFTNVQMNSKGKVFAKRGYVVPNPGYNKIHKSSYMLFEPGSSRKNFVQSSKRVHNSVRIMPKWYINPQKQNVASNVVHLLLSSGDWDTLTVQKVRTAILKSLGLQSINGWKKISKEEKVMVKNITDLVGRDINRLMRYQYYGQ